MNYRKWNGLTDGWNRLEASLALNQIGFEIGHQKINMIADTKYL